MEEGQMVCDGARTDQEWEREHSALMHTPPQENGIGKSKMNRRVVLFRRNRSKFFEGAAANQLLSEQQWIRFGGWKDKAIEEGSDEQWMEADAPGREMWEVKLDMTVFTQ
jgi:hypothetical protein